MTEIRIPRFVVILDQAGARLPVTDVARRAIAGGADLIQVREKERPESEVEKMVATVVEAVGDRLMVAVNGSPRIAARLGTNLHLPDHDPRQRDEFGLVPGAALSRSVHDSVGDTDADYVVLGNLLETPSKPGKLGLGLASFREIAAGSPVPVLAIGGIRPNSVAAVFAAGGYGVAIRSHVIGAVDPEAAARSVRLEIDKCVRISR